MTSVEDTREKRFQFLHKLYEETEGDNFKRVNMWQHGEELGFNRDETQKITQYLKGEYLLEIATLDGGISITHEGVKEIEDAISHPESSTNYFPPVNIINVHHMEGSQIQQGTTNSTQINEKESKTPSGKWITSLTIKIIGGLIVAAIVLFFMEPLKNKIVTPEKTPQYSRGQISETDIHELKWIDVNGKNLVPYLDKAIDMHNAKQISIEGKLLGNKPQKNRNIELEILTSTIEGGSYLNYYIARVRNDGTVNFALTEKPGFMKLRLHVNDGKKADFKVLVSVTY